jgi:dihydrofolate synthase/folylpolyglutamate synthase
VERARATEDIAVVAESLGLDFECQPTVYEAIERAKCLALAGDAIFIGGSNFVVAEIPALLTE